MTAAVVLALSSSAEGSCAALLPFEGGTLLSRLLSQLRTAGAADVCVVTRPAWAEGAAAEVGRTTGARVVEANTLGAAFAVLADVAASGGEDLLVAEGNVLTSSDVIVRLLNDPRVQSGGVVSRSDHEASLAPAVRLDRGRITSAASPFHTVSRNDAEFLCLLKLGAAHREGVLEAAREAATLLEEGLPSAWREQSDPSVDPLDGVTPLLLTALCRAGVLLTASYLRALFWARPRSEIDVTEAAASLAAIDEDAVRLRSAVKAQDGFFTTFFVSPYSKYIARWAARRGMTPNQVTSVSMLIGILAAAAFATGSRPGLVAGAVLLQLAFTTDCVDGQLARYTQQFSSLGAWLDSVFDRGKEYVVFAGLAVGGVRMGEPDTVWLLAAAALAVQTMRHTLDFSWAAAQHQEVAAAPAPPLSEPQDQVISEPRVVQAEAAPVRRRGALSALGQLAVSLSRALEHHGWTKWVKRIVVLPIGERFALISLTAALFTPRVTFIALLAWGAVAVAYSLTGRILRSVV